ncbi:MAG: flippase [Syntrophobacterales bacterium]|jgi:O-antigen/teichoic acid export membrane protein|nr:flippase [Syntrophobacterales bacterium]
MAATVVQRLSKNILYNVIASFFTFGINFALLPFIVSHVGKEVYGIYTLVMVITGYLALFDFGLTGAIIKYVAEYSGRTDYKRANEVISAAFAILTLLGLAVALILFLASFGFDLVFQVDEANKVLVKQLFWVTAAASLFIWPGKVFDASLHGFQKYNWIAVSNILSAISIGSAAYIIFTNGLSITYYLAIYFLISIIKSGSAFVLVYCKLIKGKLILYYFPAQILNKLWGFGSFLFMGSVVNIIVLQFDNIIIGAFLSVSAVTIYAVVYNLQNMFRIANSLIASPLFPFYAEMEGQERYDQQQIFLMRGTKFMSLFFVSTVVITLIFSGPIILHWMGDSFRESILPAQILISFWIFNGTLEVGAGMLTGKGFVKIPFYINLLNAACNLGLSLILIRHIGILGVVIGTTLPMICISFPLLLRQVLKVVDVNFKEFFQIAIRSNLILYVMCGVMSFLVQRIIAPDNLWIVIAEMAVVYGITLGIGYRFFLSPPERDNLHSMAKYCLGKTG